MPASSSPLQPPQSEDSPSRPSRLPPVFNVPTLVLVVLATLIACHLALFVLGEEWQLFALYLFSFIPSRLGGGEPIPAVPGSQIWTFLTYAFLHGDWFHLGSNCIWLLIYSTPVVRRLGSVRYLGLLAFSAIAGAAAMLPFHWGQFVVVVGASAAVSGSLAAAIPIMFAPGFHRRAAVETVAPLSLWALLRNGPALFFTAVFVALQIFTGSSQMLLGTAFLDERSIAWEAHLGGFVAGLIWLYLVLPPVKARFQQA